MRQRKTVLMWVLAVALLVALPVTQALADPPTMPADKVKTAPGYIPPVPRGMPDLTPYWKFDPPKSPLFDISKLTVSGDARVRYEYRNNANFGTNLSSGGRASGSNAEFIQQWMRLGLNYAISQDVDTFFQMQYAKNWGSGNTPTAANDANTLTGVGVRQAYIMIRNLGIEGLSLKAGRQLLVMGNHRLFGHFDWNNVGFSHDGITLQYNQPKYEIWAGWVRLADTEAFNSGTTCAGNPGCTGDNGGVAGVGQAGSNADLVFTRLAFKPMPGLSLEPLWVFLNNKTAGGSSITTTGAGSSLAAHAPGQNRHTLGGRAAFKQGMFDATAEYYWQTGSMGVNGSPNRLHINAQAMAFVAGVTLKDVPTSPRFGLEFNYASGDGDNGTCTTTTSCHGNNNTFENLYPTNHILMGYADNMAWRNMVGYSADVQLKPSKETHFEAKYWIFRKANNNDCWYTANQSCNMSLSSANTGGVVSSNSLFQEIDGIYTVFFKDNKVAWQTGASYLMAGEAIDQAFSQSANGSGAVNQVWAYTQLHVNF